MDTILEIKAFSFWEYVLTRVIYIVLILGLVFYCVRKILKYESDLLERGVISAKGSRLVRFLFCAFWCTLSLYWLYIGIGALTFVFIKSTASPPFYKITLDGPVMRIERFMFDEIRVSWDLISNVEVKRRRRRQSSWLEISTPGGIEYSSVRVETDEGREMLESAVANILDWQIANQANARGAF